MRKIRDVHVSVESASRLGVLVAVEIGTWRSGEMRRLTSEGSAKYNRFGVVHAEKLRGVRVSQKRLNVSSYAEQ